MHSTSSQHRFVSRRCGGFTYVSVSASACKNAHRRLPVWDNVADVLITQRTSANDGVSTK